ncbi:MAG TPA: hypothetical protein VMB21_08040 [Candidatus Limnocylindria bacterium]|jgi:hypothetical protein|nr:hypothetical protein [Candidatus Limnocylindria bacterium]
MRFPRLPCAAVRLWLGCILALLLAPLTQAKIQFDVFAGYGDAGGGVVRAGGWYPVAIEVFNDGPTFDAVIEISAGQFGSQTQRLPVELPTNTRKRLVFPFFCASAGYLTLDARLLDRNGKVRDERLNNRLSIIQWETPLLGALPASFGGMPAFPNDRQRRPEWQPTVARLQSEFVPDNPIALEGLNALYLNTAKALELKEPQINALLSWVHGGGHLIVAVDQPGDLNAAGWLRELLPADVASGSTVRAGTVLEDWVIGGDWSAQYGYAPPVPRVRSSAKASKQKPAADPDDPYSTLTPESEFAGAELAVVSLQSRDGKVALKSGTAPLIVSGSRGRGLVTLLAFNPEREPFRSWKHRTWFWARLVDVPPALLRTAEFTVYGGRSLDAVFGGMVDTRQVRKLPIGFLLLLLVVYLVVIGPLDQWWLKKINRPMLTWITFPAYVALFSLLIYLIGYKLRAGQTEWNEVHIVDILPQGDGTRAVLRGRTFTSIYSPRNDTYKVATELQHATFRAEFQGLWGNGNDNGKVTVQVKPVGFEAEVFVPVWTSQMNVADWLDTGDSPLTARLAGTGDQVSLHVENRSGHRIAKLWVISAGGAPKEFDELPVGGAKDLALAEAAPTTLEAFVALRDSEFQTVVARREETFGGSGKTHIDDWAGASAAASFGSLLHLNNGDSRNFVWPAGLDLAPLAQRKDTIVLAWLPDASLVPGFNKFLPKRTQTGTLLRLVLPAHR